jgi:hypothetical protein
MVDDGEKEIISDDELWDMIKEKEKEMEMKFSNAYEKKINYQYEQIRWELDNPKNFK